PAAPAWPGRIGLVDLAERQLRRRAASRTIAAETPLNKLQDPGFARFRADGELHRYAPKIVAEVQAQSGFAPAASAEATSAPAPVAPGVSVVRDLLRVRRPRGVVPVPLDEVE